MLIHVQWSNKTNVITAHTAKLVLWDKKYASQYLYFINCIPLRIIQAMMQLSVLLLATPVIFNNKISEQKSNFENIWIITEHVVENKNQPLKTRQLFAV